MRALTAVIALSSLAACGKSEPHAKEAPKQAAPATEPETDKPSAAAKPEEPVLPDAGMLCFTRRESYLWKPDGTIAAYEDSPELVSAPDGSLWEVVRGGGPDAPTVMTARTKPGGPDVTLPHPFGTAWRSASGSVLSVSMDGDPQVYRGGAWRKLTAPASVTSTRVSSVAEHEGSWWVQASSSVFHETGDALVEVKLDGITYPSGLVQHGDELSVLYGLEEYGKTPLLMARAKGGAFDKPTRIGALITMVSNPRVVSNATGSWAVYSGGGVFGTIFASLGAGKVTNVSREALAVLAVDGHDRIWYQKETGFVVRAPDGTERVYPKANHAMFQLEAPICHVLGKGFDQLPGAGETQMGTVTVEVDGAANVPVAVCDKLLGARRCEDSTGKHEGTLDADGKWTTQVPIGTYEATVKVDGAWLVADFQAGVGAHTSPWFCEVKSAAGCTIKLRAR